MCANRAKIACICFGFSPQLNLLNLNDVYFALSTLFVTNSLYSIPRGYFAVFLSFFFFFFSVIYFHICPSSFVLFDCTAPFHFIARYFISSGKSFPLFYWFFFLFCFIFLHISNCISTCGNQTQQQQQQQRRAKPFIRKAHGTFVLSTIRFAFPTLCTHHYVWVPQTKRNITQSKK